LEPEFASGPQNGSVWWSWTAPASGTCLLTLGGTAVTLEVLKGDSHASAQWVNGTVSSSNICFSTQAGTTFHFGVLGSSSDRSPVHLRLQYISAPPNDNFADASPLLGCHAIASGDTFGATYESLEPMQISDAKSIWWKWTAAHDGAVYVRFLSLSAEFFG